MAEASRAKQANGCLVVWPLGSAGGSFINWLHRVSLVAAAPCCVVDASRAELTALRRECGQQGVKMPGADETSTTVVSVIASGWDEAAAFLQAIVESLPAMFRVERVFRSALVEWIA